MFDNVANKTASAPLKATQPLSEVGPLAPASGMRKNEAIRKKERFIENFSRIFSTAIIVVLILAVIGLVFNYYFSVISLNKRINEVEAEYAQKAVVINKFQGLSGTLRSLEGVIPTFEEMVPQKKSLTKVLLKMEDLAFKYNLVFNSINNMGGDEVLKEAVSEGLKKQSYEVVLSSGDYDSLKNFIVDIEKNMRIIDIRSLVYSPDINMFFLNFEIYYIEDYAS